MAVSRKRTTIQDWIAQCLTDSDKDGPCTGFSLVYLKSGAGTEEVHSKRLEGNQNAQQLAAFFTDRACGYAQDLPGIQYFKLLAFFGREEPQGTFPFSVNEGELTGGEHGLNRHEATPTGLLGQFMKHNEALMGMAIDVVRTMAVESVKREAGMRNEVMEAHAVIKDVILNMKKESHEMRMQELQFARSTDERRLMAKMLPTVVNQLSGRDLIPEDRADTELVEALAQHVKPEQIQQLAQFGMIPGPVAALLTARFAKVHEQRVAEQRAIAAAPPEVDDTPLDEVG